MKILFRSAAQVLVALSLMLSFAHATVIDFTSTSLGGNRWRTDYVIYNDTLPGPLDEFTIYFDENLFANLADATGPASWDTLAIAPDTGIPAAGYLDGLALAGGIAVGDTLGGFSITFDFFGAGAPGAQLFSIVDPLTFVEIDSGVTGTSAVPLPGTVPLMLAGLASLACLRRHHGKGGLQ